MDHERHQPELHELRVDLDFDRPTASLLRVISLVHAHGAELHSASFGISSQTSRATAVISVAGHPAQVAILGRKLRRMVESIDVAGPSPTRTPATSLLRQKEASPMG